MPDGKDQIRVPISWSFGLGAAGQTYLLFRKNAWYASRLSYYRDTSALDLTTGARPDVPMNLEEAFGRELSPKGEEECFHCHSTGALVNGKLQTEALIARVQCTRCHERADEHMASVQQSAAKAKVVPHNWVLEQQRTCLNSAASAIGPGLRLRRTDLTTSPMSDSSRTASQTVNGYDVTDARIPCTACHDVHSECSTPPLPMMPGARHATPPAVKSSRRYAKPDRGVCHMSYA